jgi:hypothetical protein
MIGFIGNSLRLQSIITAHTLNSWTKSVRRMLCEESLSHLISHSSDCSLTTLKFESSLRVSYVPTDGQSASLSWNKSPSWGLRPHFYYCQTLTNLLMWGALSDERTGLSFTIAAGPCQCSHSRDRIPRDSRQYFTLSDSRILFSSPPTTRRVTVQVFDPVSTRVTDWLTQSQIESHIATEWTIKGHSIRFRFETHKPTDISQFDSRISCNIRHIVIDSSFPPVQGFWQQRMKIFAHMTTLWVHLNIDRSLTNFHIGTAKMEACLHSYFLTSVGSMSHYCNGLHVTVQLAVIVRMCWFRVLKGYRG